MFPEIKYVQLKKIFLIIINYKNIFVKIMKIIGIDPWTTTIWYAVCDRYEKDFQILDYWVIETLPNTSLESKLLEIGKDFEVLIKKYQPKRCAIEKLFFNTNITTWIAVSHARWVLLYECMKSWIEIYEYAPLQVKKWLTWNGAAKKEQVQQALCMLLWLTQIPKPDDAADALALAYIWSLKI